MDILREQSDSLLEKKVEEVVIDGTAHITVYMKKEDTGLSGKALDVLSEPLSVGPGPDDTVRINPNYEVCFFFPTYMWDGVSNESARVGTVEQEEELDKWVKNKIYGREVSADPSGYGFSTWYNYTELNDERFMKIVNESLKGCPEPYRKGVEIRMTKGYSRSWS